MDEITIICRAWNVANDALRAHRGAWYDNTQFVTQGQCSICGRDAVRIYYYNVQVVNLCHTCVNLQVPTVVTGRTAMLRKITEATSAIPALRITAMDTFEHAIICSRVHLETVVNDATCIHCHDRALYLYIHVDVPGNYSMCICWNCQCVVRRDVVARKNATYFGLFVIGALMLNDVRTIIRDILVAIA